MYKPTNEEIEKARLHNERVRRDSFNKREKDQGLKQRIVEKAKDKLPGKSPSREQTDRT